MQLSCDQTRLDIVPRQGSKTHRILDETSKTVNVPRVWELLQNLKPGSVVKEAFSTQLAAYFLRLKDNRKLTKQAAAAARVAES